MVVKTEKKTAPKKEFQPPITVDECTPVTMNQVCLKYIECKIPLRRKYLEKAFIGIGGPTVGVRFNDWKLANPDKLPLNKAEKLAALEKENEELKEKLVALEEEYTKALAELSQPNPVIT